MSNYDIKIQKARGGYRVVLYSAVNGKLILQGEIIKNQSDAQAIHIHLVRSWNDKRDGVSYDADAVLLPTTHKWPKNSGPKKRFVVTAGYAYSIPSAKDVKKLSKKSPPHIKAWLGVPKKTKKK